MKQQKLRDQHQHFIRLLATLILLILVCVIFSGFWKGVFGQHLWIEGFWNKGNKLIVVLYGMIFLTFMYVYGGYKVGNLRIGSLIFSQLLAICFTNFVMYIQIYLLWRHLPYILPMLEMTLMDLAAAFLCSWVSDLFYRKICPPRALLLIYGEFPQASLERKFSQREDKYTIVKSISADDYDEEELFNQISKYGRMGIILADLHSEQRNRILKYCYKNGIRVYMTPKISDIIVHNADMLHIFDTPLFLAKGEELPLEQKLLKRIMDVVISLILLVLASPVMLVTAFLIHNYDKGPVFFKQKRLTLNGKEFEVIKFRSMIVDAEKDGVARLATEHDSRITPVGKFIRATRIDELPQLINILKGDMSVVGPRPERPEIAKEYEKEIPEFALRLKAKAGLTGYAQIYGKYNTTAYDKLKLDLMYIESWSLLLDIRLILETVKIVFMKESTEGLEEGKTISTMEKKEKI